MTHARMKEEVRVYKCIVWTFFKFYCLLIECKRIRHLFHVAVTRVVFGKMSDPYVLFPSSTHDTQYPIAIYHQFMQQIFSYVQETYFSYSLLPHFVFYLRVYFSCLFLVGTYQFMGDYNLYTLHPSLYITASLPPPYFRPSLQSNWI